MADDRMLLTVPDAAGKLGISRSFLYNLLARGELPSVRLGRARRIPVAILERFVEKHIEERDGSPTEM